MLASDVKKYVEGIITGLMNKYSTTFTSNEIKTSVFSANDTEVHVPTVNSNDSSTKAASTAFVKDVVQSSGGGDMLRSVYDPDQNGIIGVEQGGTGKANAQEAVNILADATADKKSATLADTDEILVEQTASNVRTWGRTTLAKVWDYIKSKIKSVLHVDTGTIDDIFNVYGAKNLIPYPYRHTTGTYMGNVSITVNQDYSITVNGTSSNSGSFNLNYPADVNSLIKLDKNKTYVFRDSTKIGVKQSYSLGVRYFAEGVTPSTSTGTNVSLNADNNYQVTIQNAVYAYVYLYIWANKTIDNVTFYPLFTLASIQDDTYVPYVPTNKELMSCKLNGYVGAKNLLPYPYRHTTRNSSGVTFTDNGDGTITANGTATADTSFELNNLWSYSDDFNMNGKTYMLTGLPIGSDSTTYYFQGLHKNGTDSQDAYIVYANSDGNVVAPRSANDHVGFRIVIKSGQTVSNLVFKPMLRHIEDTDPTWQPYAKTNKELTDDSANKTDLTDINITSGTTNNTGSTIASGTFFYYKDSLVKAKTDIANGATLTLNTNYEKVTAGGLNALNSALTTREATYSNTTDANGSVLLYIDNNKTTRANPNYHIIDYVEITDSNGNAVAGIPCPRNTDYLYRAISMVNGSTLGNATLTFVVGYHNKL